MTDGQHIAEEDLALYAMHSLDPEQQAVVKTHMAVCPACRYTDASRRREGAICPAACRGASPRERRR
jgi:anti-sigma factor ChrR (cupin superfamily)